MTARNTVDFFSRTAPEKAEAQALRSATPVSTAVAAATDYPGVTIVVPCFNEEPMLPYLQGKLRSMREALSDKYDVHLILADDGSTDNTWQVMQDLFGYEANCSLVRQEQNLGVAGTILNGIRRSKTEIVCSIDSDCTYEPRELSKLLPMLTTGVDLVTGSPYHPEGEVLDVPRWRLALSKTASSLYRRVLKHKLYTYTSCFRVYRRSAILRIDLRRPGFLGIAEMIGKLDLQGSRIVECPTRLAARAQGVSKMRTARVLVGHLYLLGQLLAARGHQRLFSVDPRTE